MAQKTAWEILRDKMQGGPPPLPEGRAFYNPLNARIGQPQLIDVDGVHLKDYTWTVAGIVEATHTLDGTAFKFADYVLDGVNGATFAAEDKKTARLRAFPNSNGGVDRVFLELEDEFGFSEDFLAVVNDTTGKFEIGGDGEPAAVFMRINGVAGSYRAALLRVNCQAESGNAVNPVAGELDAVFSEIRACCRECRFSFGCVKYRLC